MRFICESFGLISLREANLGRTLRTMPNEAETFACEARWYLPSSDVPIAWFANV